MRLPEHLADSLILLRHVGFVIILINCVDDLLHSPHLIRHEALVIRFLTATAALSASGTDHECIIDHMPFFEVLV